MAAADKILLLGFEQLQAKSLAEILKSAGCEAFLAPWEGLILRSMRRQPPILIIANADNPAAGSIADFCTQTRILWGERFPVVVSTASKRFSEICSLLDAGAAACISPDASPEFIARKLASALSGGARHEENELTQDVPPEMAGIFKLRAGFVPLGEIADVWPGAVPRRSCWRRMAPPDEFWRGVITADNVHRYTAGRADSFLRWNKMCLFRVPLREEYDVPEKVLLRRAGPPLAAAVDRSHMPAGMGVLSLVPKNDISAGYIACLLNSRLLDFYFNRIVPVSNDGHINPVALRAVPVPLPTTQICQEFSRSCALLAHYGPHPQTWIDRQSKEDCERSVEDAIFSLYGADRTVRNGLAAMYF